MAVSKRLRFEILRRDNHTCRYCGGAAPEVTITVDHVVPTTLGGSDDPSNLVAACRDCNAGKSSVPADATVVADVGSDALRWAAAIRHVAEQERAEHQTHAVILADFLAYWKARNPYWAMPEGDWEGTISQFVANGLTAEDLEVAARIATTKYGVTDRNRWRYFCGVCWGKIRERHEKARALLAATTSEPVDHCGDPWCDAHSRTDERGQCENCGQLMCEWHCGYKRGRNEMIDYEAQVQAENGAGHYIYDELAWVTDDRIRAAFWGREARA